MTVVRAFGALTLCLCGVVGCDDEASEELPAAAAGDATNLVFHEQKGLVYAALGNEGLGVFTADGTRVQTLDVGLDSVDDVAIDADRFLLFVLDAQRPGRVRRLAVGGTAPEPFGDEYEVDVGPFSGVSAQGGDWVVSGGTGELTMFDEGGSVRFTGDYGRGQPDVLLAGGKLYVSTHFGGPDFGLTVVDARDGAVLSSHELPDAGFTDGGSSPANFPIEAAVAGPSVLVAHGGGLAVVSGDQVDIVDVGFPAVSVDARGGTAAVVGAGPSAALVDLLTREVTPLSGLPADARPTGVVLTDTRVLVAAGPVGVVALSR